MALTKCRECGHQVAKSAPTCPNCGVKDPGKGPLDIKIGGCGGCLAIIVVVLLIGSLASVFESDNRPSTVTVPAPTPLRRWVWSAANVREGRGTNTPVVRTLPAGTEIGVMNAENNWWEVYVGGQRIGFIANSVIRRDPPATARRQRPSQQTVRITSSSPPEAKLAAIDHDSRTLPAVTIRQYASFLDRLEPRCRQSRTLIADMVVASRDQLRERYRKRTTLLAFLGLAVIMMDESDLKEQDCAETFTLLVITLGNS